jgi:type IV pilus biogenesis protein PilP
MCNSKKQLTLCSIGLCALLIACAPLHTQAETAEEIAKINEDIAVLSAKLSEAEIRTKLAAKKQELVKINTPQAKPEEVMPVVSAIEGADGRLIATLITENGSKRSVVKGSKVGNWTVANIGVNSVTLKKGKRVTELGFGNVPPKPTPQPRLSSNDEIEYAPPRIMP